ncbi:MAG: DEAD/DEAH box helicase [Actinobacteria bacterium]|nr:DEAD/DEAH box helicase [Actinomycetota bacterium]
MPDPTQPLEIVWQNDTAFALGPVEIGDPVEIYLADELRTGRRLSLGELVSLASAERHDLGASARTAFAVVALARRAVSEGLVNPQLTRGGTTWYAFWGATLDESIQGELDSIAAAAPAVSGAIDELYPLLVDRIARDRLIEAGVELGEGMELGRSQALVNLLAGLTAPDPDLPPGPTYGALERRLSRWVDAGLQQLTATPWLLGLHLDERPGSDSLGLELWLHAGDDPTLALPASLLWQGSEGFEFVRDGDPYTDLAAQLDELAPLLGEGGIEFDEEEPSEVELDTEDVSYFLRELMPQLEKRNVPVLLPSSWVRAPTRIRANLTASGGPERAGFMSTSDLASFDWKLAVGDVDLSEQQLRELAAAKAPVVHAGGRWHAIRPSEVGRALRFLEKRKAGGGVVDLVRAASGIEVDEAGLEMGAVSLDTSLSDLLQGDARFAPMPAPPGMTFPLFGFQERGHGWLRMLGDLGIGAVLADDMGLGKTVQAIAMLMSEREQFGRDAMGPTLVVCPMSVARQWLAEVERFAPSLRVHLHHGSDRLADDALLRCVQEVDVVITSYDIVTRDIDTLGEIRWDRLLLDEAQDVKNPATKRARALRQISARRRVAMTGTPIENHLGELWALMDILNPGLLGSREWFGRTFARPIQLTNDEPALERLRAVVKPFILRRAKDSPEVELDLPPITVEKDYCRLTVEQASLYQATVDNWMPRIEAHDDRFGRRGAVLAMLGHLKQVCNHPEMLLHTGQPLAGRSGKLERMVELLGEMPADDKALVFTQYPSFDRLVPYLEEQTGRQVGFFHGRLNARQRDELLAAFATPEGPSILVISIRAGGRGLNLPAANHVFHFDRWWNPAVEQQATDRAHRLGQRKPVFVHSLICSGTLEERIDALLDSKRELVAKVMAGTSDDWLGDLDLGAIRAAVALAPDAVEQEVAV